MRGRDNWYGKGVARGWCEAYDRRTGPGVAWLAGGKGSRGNEYGAIKPDAMTARPTDPPGWVKNPDG